MDNGGRSTANWYTDEENSNPPYHHPSDQPQNPPQLHNQYEAAERLPPPSGEAMGTSQLGTQYVHQHQPPPSYAYSYPAPRSAPPAFSAPLARPRTPPTVVQRHDTAHQHPPYSTVNSYYNAQPYTDQRDTYYNPAQRPYQPSPIQIERRNAILPDAPPSIPSAPEYNPPPIQYLPTSHERGSYNPREDTSPPRPDSSGSYSHYPPHATVSPPTIRPPPGPPPHLHAHPTYPNHPAHPPSFENTPHRYRNDPPLHLPLPPSASYQGSRHPSDSSSAPSTIYSSEPYPDYSQPTSGSGTQESPSQRPASSSAGSYEQQQSPVESYYSPETHYLPPPPPPLPAPYPVSSRQYPEPDTRTQESLSYAPPSLPPALDRPRRLAGYGGGLHQAQYIPPPPPSHYHEAPLPPTSEARHYPSQPLPNVPSGAASTTYPYSEHGITYPQANPDLPSPPPPPPREPPRRPPDRSTAGRHDTYISSSSVTIPPSNRSPHAQPSPISRPTPPQYAPPPSQSLLIPPSQRIPPAASRRLHERNVSPPSPPLRLVSPPSSIPPTVRSVVDQDTKQEQDETIKREDENTGGYIELPRRRGAGRPRARSSPRARRVVAGASSSMRATPSAGSSRDDDGLSKQTNACHFCRGRKLKCSGGQPCRNCDKRGIECTYDAFIRRRGKGRKKKEREHRAAQETTPSFSVYDSAEHDQQGLYSSTPGAGPSRNRRASPTTTESAYRSMIARSPGNNSQFVPTSAAPVVSRRVIHGTPPGSRLPPSYFSASRAPTGPTTEEYSAPFEGSIWDSSDTRQPRRSSLRILARLVSTHQTPHVAEESSASSGGRGGEEGDDPSGAYEFSEESQPDDDEDYTG